MSEVALAKPVSDAARRNRRNRAAGGSWESRLEREGREFSLDIERTRNSGVQDQGDLVIRIAGKYHVIEAKNVKRINLTDFVRQAELERDNFGSKRGLPESAVYGAAWIKQQGKASMMDGFVVMSGREYVRLLKSAVS